MIIQYKPTGEIVRWSSSTMDNPDNLLVIEADIDSPWGYRIVDGEVVPLPPQPYPYAVFDYAVGDWVIDYEADLAALRQERDRRLAASDWTQVPDAPVDQAAWAAYRQALRDLPANTLDPRAPVWPLTPPEQGQNT